MRPHLYAIRIATAPRSRSVRIRSPLLRVTRRAPADAAITIRDSVLSRTGNGSCPSHSRVTRLLSNRIRSLRHRRGHPHILVLESCGSQRLEIGISRAGSTHSDGLSAHMHVSSHSDLLTVSLEDETLIDRGQTSRPSSSRGSRWSRMGMVFILVKRCAKICQKVPRSAKRYSWA